QAGEDSAVGVGERGLADLALQDQQLVPQRQDLHVLLSVAHWQQAQERKGVGHGETRKTQQHENHDAVDALRRWRQQGEGKRSRRSGIKRFTWADELSAPAEPLPAAPASSPTTGAARLPGLPATAGSRPAAANGSPPT
ncbi:hypothetical protein, partial [Streptomyces mirabilis]|uniref:hypothetical protein n=1 Tax=Streptomyces mirabilis TaxID=68239 RepID=UPI0036D1972F